jgi:hypothetical protein
MAREREPNREGPTGTSSSRARGSEVRGGSEDDENLQDVAQDQGKVGRRVDDARDEADQSGTRGERGQPAGVAGRISRP